MNARRLGGLLLAAAVVLSACAGIPSSGPVTKVRDDAGLGGSTVRYSPAGPVEGGSPQQIVRGFLDAMLAYPASTRTAAAFLTPESAVVWNPATKVSVYSAPTVGEAVPSSKALDGSPRGSAGSIDVRFDMTLEAVLDSQGHYTHRGTPDTMTFRLQRVENEWRIINPPDGLMINAKFFSDYLRPFNLYFFDRPSRRLVPDPVHLVVGDQLATSLVTSLVRGQRKELRDATRTFVPPLAVLRPSVPVSADGLAEVEFTADLNSLSDSASDRMSAQLVWTLRQVPSIDAVQILGDTSSLLDARQTIQPVSSWGGFGPRPSSGRAHAVIDDRVVRIDHGDVSQLSGEWGKNARSVEFIAVSEDAVAGVLPGRRQVRITNRAGADARIVAGDRFIAPQWDADGQLWLVDATGLSTRVRVGRVGGLRPIDIGALAKRNVDTFVLSPDGTRYAVGTRSGSEREIRVGMVLRDDRDRVTGLGPASKVFTPAVGPRSISWTSGTELGFLADGRDGTQVSEAAIDGSLTTSELDRGAALLPDAGITSLALGAGQMLDQYASDAKGRLWFRPADGAWRLLDTGRVTALSYGG